MHAEGGFFFDIVVIFAAAFAGGLAARILRLPLILGYLVMGMAIGPHGMRIIGNIEEVQTLAEFGVVLLLFGVGIEISFRELRSLGKAVILIGVGQILTTVGFGLGIGMSLGWLPQQAAVFGMIVSLSSTMVVLKTLADRGELRSLHGRVLTGILLIQDLAFIPMIAILPALSGEGGPFLLDLTVGIGKAFAVLLSIAILGGRAIPWLLSRVANLGSREVFILTLIAVTFITSAITQAVGLSAALGAFLAGLLLSESEFGHRALSEVIPMRDTFSALFFVSLGMLTDPVLLGMNIWIVAAIVAVAIVVKFSVTAGLSRVYGYLPNTSLLTGLGIVQIGEFSFILAASAAESGIVDEEFLSLIIGSAVLTMAATPGIMAWGSRSIVHLSQRFRILHPYRIDTSSSEEQDPPIFGHAIICGLGRVGSLVARALDQHQVPFIIIDDDPQVTISAQNKGYYVIHGASANEIILDAAHVKTARLMVICMGDSVTARTTAQQALAMNPNLDIVARTYVQEEGVHLQSIGVKEVVWPDMEAGLEILRHSLERYNINPMQVDSQVQRLRTRLSLGAQTKTGRSIDDLASKLKAVQSKTNQRTP